jgi:5-methylcytosine-specific restriction endonuclease McrA
MPTRLCWCGRPPPCSLHPRIRRSGSSRPSLNQRGWKKKAAWVKQRDGLRCTECGETEGLVCHHIVRPQDGGTDESSNLTTLCRRCHGNAHVKRREEDPMVVFLRGVPGRPCQFSARDSEKKREKGESVKRCRNCSQVKRSDQFRSNAHCRDGLSSWCSDCHNAATRGYRARIREAEAQARELERIESNERLRVQERERRARWERAAGIRRAS